MERLTEKYSGVIWLDGKKHYMMKKISCFDSYRKDREDVVDKLGQLEDIEEELGFELCWLFSAIINKDNMGVVHFKYKGKTYKIEELGK